MTFGALLFYRFAVKNSQIVFLVAAAQVLARVDCGRYLTLLMTVCRTVLCHNLYEHSQSCVHTFHRVITQCFLLRQVLFVYVWFIFADLVNCDECTGRWHGFWLAAWPILNISLYLAQIYGVWCRRVNA